MCWTVGVLPHNMRYVAHSAEISSERTCDVCVVCSKKRAKNKTAGCTAKGKLGFVLLLSSRPVASRYTVMLLFKGNHEK